jgi:hypothetical protein
MRIEMIQGRWEIGGGWWCGGAAAMPPQSRVVGKRGQRGRDAEETIMRGGGQRPKAGERKEVGDRNETEGGTSIMCCNIRRYLEK